MSPSRRMRLLSLTLPLCAGLFSCQTSSVHIRKYVYAYGTTWEIHLYEGNESLGDQIATYIEDSSNVLDPEGSLSLNGVGALNQKGVLENANPLLLEALELGNRVEKVSHGVFSLVLGDLKDAWISALEQGKRLGESTRDDLLSKAKATTVTIDGQKAIKVGEGKLDLGSIGKGLCLDHIQKTLNENHVTKYLINAGSSSLLIGQTPEGKEVKVSLEDAPGKYFLAKDCGVSTSSSSRQSYVVDGVTYSHIIDARDGEAKMACQALVLKGQGAGWLDGLSTGFSCLGKDYAKEIEELGVSCAYVEDDKVSYASEGFLQGK